MLADGNEMPLLGLGVWQIPNGPPSRNRRTATESRRNGRIFEFTLSDEEITALDALDETGGTERPRS